MPAKRRLPHKFKRFRQWLKQVILLGRTDWRKASDDASPPRLSQTERNELQPHFDVNVIKPRSVTPLDRAGSSTPVPISPRAAKAPSAQAPLESPTSGASKPPKSRVFRKHHRERPAQIAVNPLSAFTPDKLPASRLERLYEKFFGRRG
jgi:hypothetical protein